jgi:hypothetical protein
LGVKTLAQDLAFNSLAQDKIYSLNWQINRHFNKHKMPQNSPVNSVLVKVYKLLDSALNTDKLPNNWVSSLVSTVRVLVCKDFKPPYKAQASLGQLGGQQFQQGMDINKLQSAYGGQMQQQAQRPLDHGLSGLPEPTELPIQTVGLHV